jgi:class 3 adenylate cyclase
VSKRITRTFAFIDLCGFTRFMSEHGDDRAAAALADVRTTVRRAAEHSAVRVCRWLGDGAMLVAADRWRLTECLEDIWWHLEDEPHLAPRCGVATGEVLIFEGDDYIGPAVNIASRLCDLARPGEIVATTANARRSPGQIQFVTVRGIHTPVEVLRSWGLRDRRPEVDRRPPSLDAADRTANTARALSRTAPARSAGANDAFRVQGHSLEQGCGTPKHTP